MKLTTKEVIAEIRKEIRMYKASYREADGVVRDRGALRTIAAASRAIELLKRDSLPSVKSKSKTP
jgi:hypothetical protein